MPSKEKTAVGAEHTLAVLFAAAQPKVVGSAAALVLDGIERRMRRRGYGEYKGTTVLAEEVLRYMAQGRGFSRPGEHGGHVQLGGMFSWAVTAPTVDVFDFIEELRPLWERLLDFRCWGADPAAANPPGVIVVLSQTDSQRFANAVEIRTADPEWNERRDAAAGAPSPPELHVSAALAPLPFSLRD
jgi:hypothetical protein